MSKNSTICEFFMSYGNAPYVSLNRALDIKPLMTKIHDDALEAQKCFNEIVCESFKRPDYIILPETQFLNGTKMNVRTYFWAKIKYSKYVSMPDCIAVFCEKKDNSLFYRVSLEQDDKKSFIESRENRLRVLDLPLEKGLKYFVTMEDKSEHVCVNVDDVNRLISQGNRNKFQICYIIDNPEKLDDDGIIYKIKEGIDLVIKYYEHIASFYDSIND